jgi:hypothetical protein|tara:strand:- start:449 stop:607 length:159 start_codon:yes stop_codon:yes gene_type:complete
MTVVETERGRWAARLSFGTSTGPLTESYALPDEQFGRLAALLPMLRPKAQPP